MTDAHDTDYDSLEIRPRKPKLTYGRKGQRDRPRPTLPSPGAGGEHQQLAKTKGKVVRPKLKRATSAAELGKRRRGKEREESASSEDEQPTRHVKRPRANAEAPTPIASTSFSLDPSTQAKEPFPLAGESPKTKLTASTSKASTIRKSRSLSSSARRDRGAGKGGRLGGAETGEGNDDDEDGAPRKKRKIKRVASREKQGNAGAAGAEGSAEAGADPEKMDVEASEPLESTKSATSAHELTLKTTMDHQQHPQHQGQHASRPPARHSSVDSQLPPPTPRQLVLGDKSNLPRSQQNQRPSTTASPRQHARSASTTAASGGQAGSSAMVASPRGVARHASTGGVMRRGSNAGSPSTLRVYRDQPASSTSRVANETGAEPTSLNLRALSSALPTSAPLPRSQPSRSHSTSPAHEKLPSGFRPRPFSPRPSQAGAANPALTRTSTAPAPALPIPQLVQEGYSTQTSAVERWTPAIPPPLPSDGSLILPRTDGDHSSIVLETYEGGSEEEEEDEIVLAMSMVIDGAEGQEAGGAERQEDEKLGEKDGGDEEGELADDESDPIEEQDEDTIKMHDDAPQFHDPTISISAELDADSREAAARDDTAVEAPRFTSPFQQPTSPSPQAARTRVKATSRSNAAQVDPPPYSAQPLPHQQAQSTHKLFRPPSTSSEILYPRVPAPHPPAPNLVAPSLDPFAMPPRLPRLPLMEPRDTGPLSDEDDLEYFIATTGTYSSEDEEEWKKSEREVGEGMKAGGVRGGRKRRILGLDEVERVDESALDELGIGWQQAMHVVEGEGVEEVGAEGRGET